MTPKLECDQKLEPNWDVSTYVYYDDIDEVKTLLKVMLEKALESIEQDVGASLLSDLEYDVTAIHELFNRMDNLYDYQQTHRGNSQ